ncbi:CHASE2 domain-containing protein [Campylobacter concisus]|uniref:CHASE2 domain-containing protein n=1 Tax=Campylobacter concisus TaxID=199 RepID=UPI0018840270|nr:CHASE2 domain-containing protein [Campylobacter concisus]MBE9870635.1 CHASE2 domain-containing protein [Campylobacter concisus]
MASFAIYGLVKDREIVRVNFGDFEYDIMQEIYAKAPSASQSQKIAVILIDQEYLDKHDLSDRQGGIKFNFTPRSVLANVLDDFNKTLSGSGSKPKTLVLDYSLEYPSDINSTVTKDDLGLIDRLNLYASSYPIYLPKTINKPFLQDFKLNPNIKFTQTNISSDKDGVTRGYTPYLCDGDKTLRHLVLELANSEAKFTCPRELSFDESFRYRILYKDLKIIDQGGNKTYTSNYENIKFYHAARLSQIDAEEFDDAIVLIGSDYPGSGDIHKTPIGVISGVIALANALNTALNLKDGISTIPVWLGMICYLLFFGLCAYFVPRLAKALHIDGNFDLLRLSSLVIFFVPAIILFFNGRYVTWVVVLIVFKLIDIVISILKAKELIKNLSKTLLVLVVVAVIIAIMIVGLLLFMDI